MNKKTKKELNACIDKLIQDFNSVPAGSNESTVIMANATKAISSLKDIESNEIENETKLRRIVIDETKLELEKTKSKLEEDRLRLDQSKMTMEGEKFEYSKDIDSQRLDLDNEKLLFDKEKLSSENKKAKADKIFNGVIKGFEICVPIIIYGGLSVLSLKAIYKDDARIPSETWGFIKGVVSRK